MLRMVCVSWWSTQYRWPYLLLRTCYSAKFPTEHWDRGERQGENIPSPVNLPCSWVNWAWTVKKKPIHEHWQCLEDGLWKGEINGHRIHLLVELHLDPWIGPVTCGYRWKAADYLVKATARMLATTIQITLYNGLGQGPSACLPFLFIVQPGECLYDWFGHFNWNHRSLYILWDVCWGR